MAATDTHYPTPEVTVSAPIVSLVCCPCGSGEPVEAVDAGFAATDVRVAACSACTTALVTARVMRKSWLYGEAEFVRSTPDAVRHGDGLVWMVG